MGKLDQLKKAGAAKKREASAGHAGQEEPALYGSALVRAEAQAGAAALRALAEGGQYEELDIESIVFNPANDYAGRIGGETVMGNDAESLAAFADAIDREGLLHNLVVSRRPDGSNLLLSGERRLRAVQLLAARSERDRTRWKKVPCIVRTGLTEAQEMVLLDAANLETRGVFASERAMIQVVARYSRNLQQAFGLSRQAADRITSQSSGFSARTIQRALAISRMQPALADLYDEAAFTKKQADVLAALSPDEQHTAARAIAAARQAAQQAPETVGPEQCAAVLDAVLGAAGVKGSGLREKAFSRAEQAANALLEQAGRKEEAEAEPDGPGRKKRRASPCESQKERLRAMRRQLAALHSEDGPALRNLRRWEKAGDGGEESFSALLQAIAAEAEAVRAALAQSDAN